MTYVPNPTDMSSTNWVNSGECLHDIVARVTVDIPEASAFITAAGQVTSYADLDLRKRQYTCLLDQHAVGQGDCVGLHGTATVDYVAAMLAIMERGAIALPLAAGWPLAYLSKLVASAGVALVLTDDLELPQALAWLPADAPAVPAINVIVRTESDNPFLLMYTSGSTGQPKGVLHTFRQPVNRLRWMIRAFPMDANDVCAARHMIAIMPSIWEIFGGLCAGRPTVLMEAAALTDPALWVSQLKQAGVTRMTVTPALMRVLLTALEVIEPTDRPPLKLITIGGEPLPDRLVQSHHKILPDCQLLEDYGATETNTIGFGLRDTDGVPIFAPIDGVSVAITNELGTPLPEGQTGALCVAGQGLALCYWDNTELTEDKFSTIAGFDRAFHTGDRAKLLPDGRFQLLGRIGEQIKVNGLSVDLTAIENVLRNVPDVTAAAVFVHESETSDWVQLCAVVVGSDAPDAATLRAATQDQLPPHMVPTRFEFVADLPRLASGKVDRKALSGLLASEADVTDLTASVAAAFAAVIGKPMDPGQMDQPWDALGFNSLSTVAFAQALSQNTNLECDATDLFNHVTPNRLLRYLERENAITSVSEPLSTDPNINGDTVITGMSAIVPGADDLTAFWTMIRDGSVAPVRVPTDRWPDVDEDEPALRGAFLSDVMSVNAELHGLSLIEAEQADPQLRLALRAVRQCVQDAGLSRKALARKQVGVFIGVRPSGFTAMRSDPDLARMPDAFLGGDEAMIAGRIAYSYDLHGPVLTLNTTCSSALVALHQARLALARGDCDMAIVGGVSVMCDPEFLRKTAALGVLSQTGVCRPFDAAADGFVPGEAAGFILLERLVTANAQGRASYAEITSSLLNHDGLSKSLTAPNGAAQTELLQNLYGAALGCLAQVGYLETHGTGTALGDPVELSALHRVWQDLDVAAVPIGSLKANIGHTNAASGIVSLIKTALCMYHRTIPPLTNFKTPNPQFQEAALKVFEMPKTSRAWPASRPYAGVSAFGMSGTNAHILLKHADQVEAWDETDSGVLHVPVSAPTAAALRAHATTLAAWLRAADPVPPLIAFAATMQARTIEAEVAWLSVATIPSLIAALEDVATDRHDQSDSAPTPVGTLGVPLIHLPVSAENDNLMVVQKLGAEGVPKRTLEQSTQASDLAEFCTSFLGPHDWKVHEDTPFQALGLDSIKVLGLRDALRDSFGLNLTEYELLETMTLRSLRVMVPEVTKTADVTAPRTLALPEDIPASGPLTDLQSVYLTAKLTGTSIKDRLGAWNVLVFNLLERVDPDLLSSAWTAVRKRHGMLRVTISQSGRQTIAEPVQVDVPVTHMDEVSQDDVLSSMMEAAANPSTAPMAQLHVLRGSSGDQLIVAVDSFAADARSTEIFLTDLWSLYEGLEPTPDIHPHIFNAVTAAQRDMISSDMRQKSVDYWAVRIDKHVPADLPMLLGEKAAEVQATGQGWVRLTQSLPEDAIASLRETAKETGAPLMTCLMVRFREWVAACAKRPVTLGLTVAERPTGFVDVAHVVGPFTTMMLHPVDPAVSLTPAMLQSVLAADLAERSMTGTAVLRELNAPPPKIVFSAVTQRAANWPTSVTKSLSITSGLHLHVHATRDPQGDISLEWDIDLDMIGAEAANALFDDFCAAIISPIETSVRQPIASVPTVARAPLTRAMRSYLVAQATTGQASGSHATRVYKCRPEELDEISACWWQHMVEHVALHSIQTTNGQINVKPAFIAASITRFVPKPGQSAADWFAEVEASEAAALTASQWPPMRLATGEHEGQTLLFFTFDCHAFDAPSTLILPQMLLGDPQYEVEPSAGFTYAQWQAEQQGDEADAIYWQDKLTDIAVWARSAVDVPKAGSDIRLFQCRFPRPLGWDGEKLAAQIAYEFQRSLRAFPTITPLPVMVVGYGDRVARPEWQNALGDFTTFGVIPPKCADAGLASVYKALAQDNAHRRFDWFPIMAGHGTRDLTMFPTVFTDGLTGQPDHSEPGGQAVWTTSHTAGIYIDCLTYSTKGELCVEWSVNTSMLDADTASDAFDTFRSNTAAILSSSNVPDGLQWLEQQNATACDYEETATLVQRFDQAVATYAQHTALVDDIGSWTYAELAEKVQHYARALQELHGIGTGSMVAVKLPRDRRLPAVLLAILRLGAAFVPLNPGDPADRQNRMLAQAGVDLIVVEETDAAIVANATALIAALDQCRVEALPEVADHSDPHGMAYAIFTSGSTGDPKGVMVRHQPVINLIEDLQKRYKFGPTDRGIWVNAIGFDLTIFDFFGLLSLGASLRLVNETDRLDPLKIARLIGQEPITFWNSAPVYFQTVVGQLLSPRFQGTCDLRLAFFSGDWMPLDLARTCLDRLPEMLAVALGGATEAVVWSNLHEIRTVKDNWRSIPYGRPIQNARYYVLDEALNPLLPGEQGDLYIGGACLSDGYINAPESNALAFVTDPFVQNGGLMYRTGDLAQFMPNGEIEFLGRIDDQVKIRGHRIEIGEIQQAMKHAGFMSPVVLATEGGQANVVSRRLFGFHIGPAPAKAQHQLESTLPDYMQPARIVSLDSYPTTANGKLDRGALLAVAESNGELVVQTAPTLTQQHRSDIPVSLRSEVLDVVANLLECTPSELDLSLGLGHQGFNSLHFALLANSLSDLSGKDILTTDILPLASLDNLLEFVAQNAPAHQITPRIAPEEGKGVSKAPEIADDAIAVIGLQCQMPGADDASTFWSNIVQGRDCITEIPDTRWDWRAIYGDDPDQNESMSRWGGFLTQIDQFDHGRFNISPREAAAMDPRQRLLLTASWKLFEEAGYAPVTENPRKTGVFLGVTGDEYGTMLAAEQQVQDQLTLLGTGRSFIANRINYAMNWTGPSEVIDTTCSSSLVAIHHAISALQSGECDIAVAGGVSVLIDPAPHVGLSKVGVLANDGRCKTFDARANGYVRSEGVGLVLLKPLAKALADGDQVRAVIRSCHINHGGRSSALTAPNVVAQAALLEEALQEAGPGVAGLGLHEAHGTGTRLGDPIEVAAYSKALNAQLAREHLDSPPVPVSMGSLKTSIGHTEAAAGVAGFIKAVLALEHQMIPPLVHFEKQNPEITWDSAKLSFDAVAREWAPVVDHGGAHLARRASVSAFGFGGVNAFAVLEEAPAKIRGESPGGPFLFVFSARTPELLQSYRDAMVAWLEAPGEQNTLADIAYTLQVGRVQDKVRAAYMCANRAELIAALRAPNPVHDADPAADRQALAAAIARADWLIAADLWAAGITADWDPFWEARPELNVARIQMPAAPLMQEPHWHQALAQIPAKHRASWRASSDMAEGMVFRLTSRDGFLADHRIQGNVTLPGAAHIAAGIRIFDATSQRYGPMSLRDVTFRMPFTLGDAPKAEIVGHLSEQSVTISRKDDPKAILCSMQLSDAIFTDDLSDLQAHERSYDTEHDAAACASALHNLGIDYGPLYRLAQTCWRSESEALVHVQLPTEAVIENGIAIPMLDAMFQSVVLYEALDTEKQRPRVPFHIAAVDVVCDPGREGYVRILSNTDGRTADAFLYDVKGRLCVSMSGISGQEIRQNTTDNDHEVVGYTPEWVDGVLASNAPLATADVIHNPALPNDSFEFDAGGAVDWTTNGAAALSIHITEQDADPADMLTRCALFVHDICTGSDAVEWARRSVLFVLPDQADWSAQVASGLAVLGQTIKLEHQRLSIKAVLCSPDIDASALQKLHADPAPGLYRMGPHGLQSSQLRLIGRDLEGKGMSLLDGGAAADSGFVVISGGAGGIGSHLAKALVEHGAAVLVLGRAAKPVHALPEGVQYQSVDVTDLKGLAATLNTWRPKLGPVRAVYHCAGLTPGGLFMRRNPADIRAQIDVKLRGAANLDAVTVPDAPAVFVTCSSMVAHSPVVGCADYSMSNRAMEAFIATRSTLREGRSVSFAWSAWPEGGMQFTKAQTDRIASEGIKPIPPEDAMRWISTVLNAADLSVVASPYGIPNLIQETFGQTAATLKKFFRGDSDEKHCSRRHHDTDSDIGAYQRDEGDYPAGGWLSEGIRE